MIIDTHWIFIVTPLFRFFCQRLLPSFFYYIVLFVVYNVRQFIVITTHKIKDFFINMRYSIVSTFLSSLQLPVWMVVTDCMSVLGQRFYGYHRVLWTFLILICIFVYHHIYKASMYLNQFLFLEMGGTCLRSIFDRHHLMLVTFVSLWVHYYQ